jgi:hypothetical protein
LFPKQQSLRKETPMKILSRFMYVPLILAGLVLGCMLFTGNTATAQQQKTASAMDRGYRTGYTDGYQVGFVDFSNKAARDSRDHTEYRTADRAYVDTYGAIDDYKEGYRQGFEAGYDTAYDRKPFESAIPTNLRRQGDDTASEPRQSTPSTQPVQNPVADDQNNSRPRDLPTNSTLRVELQSEISTDVSQKGDQFQARVIEPQYLSGAIVKGHIAFIKRPGRVKGSGEIQLAFDQIIVEGGEPVPFDALVTELMGQGPREIGSVDSEGGVKGRSSTKDDVSKVGAGTAVGAVIGAIAGGGTGAAIGAVIGGGASTGGVLATRGKDLRLHRGQQMKIQTAKETRW